MLRLASLRALAGGLVMASLLLFTAAAQSAAEGLRGRTSQHLPISFAIRRHALRKLDFRIDDRCPSGHVWRIHDFDFPPIEISGARFHQRFRSFDGRATAEVRGRVFHRSVTGTLSDRTLIRGEGSYCRGTARFTVRR